MKISSKGSPHITISENLKELCRTSPNWKNLAWVEALATSASKSSLIFRVKTLLMWRDILQNHGAIQDHDKWFLLFDAQKQHIVKEMNGNGVRIRAQHRVLPYSELFQRALIILQLIGVEDCERVMTFPHNVIGYEIRVPPHISTTDALESISSFKEMEECVSKFPHLQQLKVPDFAKHCRIRILRGSAATSLLSTSPTTTSASCSPLDFSMLNFPCPKREISLLQMDQDLCKNALYQELPTLPRLHLLQEIIQLIDSDFVVV